MRFQSILSVLSALIASAHAVDELRGSAKHREMQYYSSYNYNNDDNDTYDAYSDNSTATTVQTTTTKTAGNLTDTMHQIQDIVVNQVQQYKAVAQSKGYEFYTTSPSEWTSNQWDFVTALFGGLILACCFFSLCCSYCCIYRPYDDEGQEAMTKAQYHKRMLNQRLNRHRARYNEKRYERDDDTIDDNTIDDTVYTLESQSTYGQSYYEPGSPMSYQSSVYITRREERKRAEEQRKKEANEQRRKEERRRERDEKREALLKKSRDEKKESLLKQSTVKESPVTRMVRVADKPKITVPSTRSRSTTPVRSTTNRNVPKESKEEADKKAVEEALSYKMHP